MPSDAIRAARTPGVMRAFGALALILCLIPGCAADDNRTTVSDALGIEPAVPARATDAAAGQRRAPAGAAIVAPTGQAETSAVMLEVLAPKQVRVGQPFDYTVKVTNVTEHPLANVIVRQVDRGVEGAPPGAAAAAGPTTQPGEQQPSWFIGYLGPNETRTATIEAVADQVGSLERCLSVDYRPAVCSTISVVQPQLELAKRGPQRIILCEPLQYTYTVRNTGTGVAQNVVITETLPDGLTTEQGQTTFTAQVGNIPAGQSREVQATFKPAEPGQYTSRAVAQSAADKAASEPLTTTVVKPNLAINVQGPEWQYARYPVTYQVIVRNTGDGEARDAVLQLATPGMGDQLADRQLGTIPPGEARQVSVTLEPQQGGKLQLAAVANAFCAEAVKEAVVTEIRTIPALLLEVVDNNDPVQIGSTTTYQIVVHNQGTGVANNVAIAAALPEGLEFVEADGATDIKVDGQQLTFAPIARLAPDETAAWQVQARAVKPGWTEFRLQMKADEMRQPAVEQEPTRLYEVVGEAAPAAAQPAQQE